MRNIIYTLAVTLAITQSINATEHCENVSMKESESSLLKTVPLVDGTIGKNLEETVDATDLSVAKTMLASEDQTDTIIINHNKSKTDQNLPQVDDSNDIIQTDNLKDIVSIVNEITEAKELSRERIYFLFDEDEVLFHRIDNACGGQYHAKWVNLAKEYSKDNPEFKQNALFYMRIICENHARMTLDPELPKFNDELQSSGIKTLILTSKPNRYIKKTKVWEHKILKKQREEFGYHFGAGWKDIEPYFFGKSGASQCYADGCIYTRPCPEEYKDHEKSYALQLFINYVNEKRKTNEMPQTIIFMDDNINYLKDMRKFANHNNIKFKGIEYTKKDKLPQCSKWDAAYEKQRLEDLVKYRKWKSPLIPDLLSYIPNWKEWRFRMKNVHILDIEIEMPKLDNDDILESDKPQGTIS